MVLCDGHGIPGPEQVLQALPCVQLKSVYHLQNTEQATQQPFLTGF